MTFKIIVLSRVDVPLATMRYASCQCTASPEAAGHILRFPGSILFLLTWGVKGSFRAPGSWLSKQGTHWLTCSICVFTKHFLSSYTAPRERGLQSHERVWHLHQLHRNLHDNEDEKMKHPKEQNIQGGDSTRPWDTNWRSPKSNPGFREPNQLLRNPAVPLP